MLLAFLLYPFLGISQNVKFILNGNEVTAVDVNRQKIHSLNVQMILPEETRKFDRIRFTVKAVDPKGTDIASIDYSQLQYKMLGSDTITLRMLNEIQIKPEDTIGMHSEALAIMESNKMDLEYYKFVNEFVSGGFYDSDFVGLTGYQLTNNRKDAVTFTVIATGLEMTGTKRVYHHGPDCYGACHRTCLDGYYTLDNVYGNAVVLSGQNHFRIIQDQKWKRDAERLERQKVAQEKKVKRRKSYLRTVIFGGAVLGGAAFLINRNME